MEREPGHSCSKQVDVRQDNVRDLNGLVFSGMPLAAGMFQNSVRPNSQTGSKHQTDTGF